MVHWLVCLGLVCKKYIGIRDTHYDHHHAHTAGITAQYKSHNRTLQLPIVYHDTYTQRRLPLCTPLPHSVVCVHTHTHTHTSLKLLGMLELIVEWFFLDNQAQLKWHVIHWHAWSSIKNHSTTHVYIAPPPLHIASCKAHQCICTH